MLGTMTRPTVLVVTDRNHGDGRDPGASALVERLGAEVTSAADAQEAVAQVVAFRFDLVVLPADPPGMCFHELARTIESMCRDAQVPCPPVWRVEASMLTTGAVVTPADRPDGDDTADESAEPAIDTATLDALESDIGDRGFVVDTVEVYLAELPERVASIAAGLEADRADDVKAIAHSLKSSSAMLGALRMASLCATLEHQGATGQGFDSTTVVAQVRAEAAAAEAGLRAYVTG
ncbi:MAG: hypothetical protein QG597_58 [Actinomycetota bacterium]|nr:hypothetical protein [Actinomycetota bacterium]